MCKIKGEESSVVFVFTSAIISIGSQAYVSILLYVAKSACSPECMPSRYHTEVGNGLVSAALQSEAALAAAGMGNDLGPAGLYQRWSELLIVAAILTVCAWEENRSLI